MTFKFLNQTNFDALLSLYDRVNTNSLKPREDNLITSIFLQIYGQLEDDLYRECEAHFIKKNASIIRFEPALKAQGYSIDNDAWQKLIQIAKIRNCLIHGNGRIDSDKYGEDTKTTVNSINTDAKDTLLEVIGLQTPQAGSAKIKIHPEFIVYVVNKIEAFIRQA